MTALVKSILRVLKPIHMLRYQKPTMKVPTKQADMAFKPMSLRSSCAGSAAQPHTDSRD